MSQPLLDCLKNHQAAICRRAATRVRQLPDVDRRKVTARSLRERFAIVLEGLTRWLERRDFERWFEANESRILDLVREEAPLSRLTRGMLTLKTVLHEELARRDGDDARRLAEDVFLTDRFFNQFLCAFTCRYENFQAELLREAEKAHSSFFKHMIFPAFLGDEEGWILEVNPAMAEFVGAHQSVLVGRHVTSLLCDSEVCQLEAGEFWRALKRQKLVNRYPFTFLHVKKGALHVEISSTFRHNVKGEIIGIQGFLQDITRRVEGEALADERLHTLQAIFEHAPAGMLYVDRHHHIRMINRRFLENSGGSRASRRQIIGRTLEQQTAKATALHTDPEAFLRFYEEVENGSCEEHVREFLLKSGRTVAVHTAPIRTDSKVDLGHIIMNRDLTHERELEAQRENLTQMIVHDLKNPLAAIKMSASLLRTILPPEQQGKTVKQALDIVGRSSNSMMRMIVNLLDISRMESEKLELKRESLDIFDFLATLRAELEALALPCALVMSRRRPLPRCEADPAILQRVIENIVSNAAKHSLPGGRIVIHVRRAGKKWFQLAIADNGEGIAKEDQAAIFEKFGQAASRQRGHKTDTGLGLTFCKMAVEAHGGHIHLASALGKGSTFTVHLPLDGGS